MERMKVRAKKPGYYGHRRIKPGQVFFLKEVKGKHKDSLKETEEKVVLSCEAQFSSKWMEKVSASQAAPAQVEDFAPEMDDIEEEEEQLEEDVI